MKTKDEIEQLARSMYDTYCEGVGGKAYNGDILPHSDEFFEDESKQLQADGWRQVATVANSGAKGTIVECEEVALDDVLKYYSKDFTVPKGRYISYIDHYVDPVKQVVIYKIYNSSKRKP